MSQTFDAATSGGFVHKMRYACATCKWTASIVLLCAGSVVMAFAGICLGYVAIEEWHLGWIARIIGVVLFCTVPALVALIIANLRSTRAMDSAGKRLAWAGMSLLGLGALEVGLALAAWILFWVFASGANHP